MPKHGGHIAAVPVKFEGQLVCGYAQGAGAVARILRAWAASAAIELAIITVIYWKTGFSWLNRGYEYTLLWGWVCFAIALRGGGPYSLDRKIGVEL